MEMLLAFSGLMDVGAMVTVMYEWFDRVEKSPYRKHSVALRPSNQRRAHGMPSNVLNPSMGMGRPNR